MFTYEITIPGKGTYEVTSKNELSDTQAYEAALSQVQQEPQKGTTLRTAEIVTRGALPPATMAATGAALGSVAGPPGAAIGALAGGLAIPVSDFLVSLYNLTQKEGVKLPSTAISEMLDSLGLARPESRGERMLEAGAGAVTGAGAQVPALARLATTAAQPAVRAVAQQAAQAPVAQTLISGPSAAVAQYTTEATGSPIAGMLAGTATGMATGVRPGRVEKGLELPDIRQQASQAYKTANQAGLVIKPSFLDDINQKIQSRLSAKAADPLGYDPTMHPEITNALKRLQTEVDAGQPVLLGELDNLRQILKAPASNFQNPKQQMITSEVVNIFDDALTNIKPADVSAGNFKLATSALENARKLYTTQKKLQTIEDLVNKASITAGGYSQSGMDNALRTQFASLAKNNKRMAQFNKDERIEIINIAEGKAPLERAMRFIGKFAVRGPVTGAVQAVIPGGGVESIIASEAAKRAAESMRQQNVQRLMEQISLGRTPESRTFELLPATTIRGLLSSQYGME